MNKSSIAASLFLLASCKKPAPLNPGDSSQKSETLVKCLGAHECKAQSQCGVPGGHGCNGQNECKGKGWVKTTEAACVASSGTVLK